MARRSSDPDRTDLQGTLDLLILRTLLLQRLQARGWIKAEWRTSENNRKAKYCTLTAQGKEQLAVETSKWERLAQAVAAILKPASD